MLPFPTFVPYVAVSATSLAALMLASETQGLALDFTDGFWSAPIGLYGSAKVKDTTTPANNFDSVPGSLLAYTGTTKLTRQSDGVYRYQAHNLCPNSESTAGWSAYGVGTLTLTQGFADPNGGTKAFQLTTDGPSRGALQYCGFTWSGDNGVAYVWVRAISGTATGFLYAQGSNNTGRQAFTATTTWTKITATAPSGTTAHIIISLDVAGTIQFAFPQMLRTPCDNTYLATTGAAKYGLPYEWDTLGALSGILVEPQATNLVAQSAMGSGLANWNVNSSTITLSSTLAPDGTQTAMRVVTTGNSDLNVSQAVSVTNGATYTGSCWVRGTAGQQIYFVADGTAAGQLLVTFTGQWQRVAKTVVATSVTAYIGFERYNRSGGAHLPDVTFDCWGAQLETGSVATSHIITYGATATRARDDIARALSLLPWSETAGTLFAVCSTRDASVLSFAVEVDNGGTVNFIAASHSDGTNGRGIIVTGGVAQANSNGGVSAASDATSKIAVAFAANDVNASLNGGIDTTDTSATLPTVSVLRIGDRAGGGRSLNGYLKKVLYLPRRMSNAELQTLTS